MNSEEVAEIKRHFEVVAERIESRVQLVAEAVSAADAKIEALRQETRTEFEETRAMIRLSYTELDRRVRTLEDSVSRLEVHPRAVSFDAAADGQRFLIVSAGIEQSPPITLVQNWTAAVK